MMTLGDFFDRAVDALIILRNEADAHDKPCSEQCRARDALEALGVDREAVLHSDYSIHH